MEFAFPKELLFFLTIAALQFLYQIYKKKKTPLAQKSNQDEIREQPSNLDPTQSPSSKGVEYFDNLISILKTEPNSKSTPWPQTQTKQNKSRKEEEDEKKDDDNLYQYWINDIDNEDDDDENLEEDDSTGTESEELNEVVTENENNDFTHSASQDIPENPYSSNKPEIISTSIGRIQNQLKNKKKFKNIIVMSELINRPKGF